MGTTPSLAVSDRSSVVFILKILTKHSKQYSRERD